MSAFARWTVAAVALLHGVIHLMGDGPAWRAAALLVIAAAVLMVLRMPRWWFAVAAAAVVSQVLIVSAWSEAWAGTAANMLLLLAAGYGYAAQGPRSFRAQYPRQVAEAEPDPGGVVTEAVGVDLFGGEPHPGRADALADAAVDAGACAPLHPQGPHGDRRARLRPARRPRGLHLRRPARRNPPR